MQTINDHARSEVLNVLISYDCGFHVVRGGTSNASRTSLIGTFAHS